MVSPGQLLTKVYRDDFIEMMKGLGAIA